MDSNRRLWLLMGTDASTSGSVARTARFLGSAARNIRQVDDRPREEPSEVLIL